MLYKYLFPRYCNEPIASMILLLLRIFFGLLIMMHGLEKLNSFSTLSLAFPDVLGMGSKTSLLLTIFAEVVCAAAFILGFMHRLVLLPLVVTMFVAFSFVHHWSVAQGELSFIYLFVFVLSLITGPGRYSIDYLISSYIFYIDDVGETVSRENEG